MLKTHQPPELQTSLGMAGNAGLVQYCRDSGSSSLQPPMEGLGTPPFSSHFAPKVLLYKHLPSPSNINKDIVVIKLEWGVHENLPCPNFFVLKKCC